ncbi:flagellar brake protein [Luteimonas huabeiensis]|uniref:flagellar brake protein n=1 Tax=Luteimonas huabeiensis TaxID=1244513 RepID=UPI0004632D0C|nr:flagellar brake protein [Luteimonas huabeiensis]
MSAQHEDAPPLPAPAAGADDLRRYEKRAREDVRRLLKALAAARALVSAHAVPGERPCPTAVLEVGDDDTVLIDGHAHEAVNRRLLQAHHLVCVCRLDRVRIQFRLQRLRPVRIDGRAAFLAPLPGAILELQRREAYRLAIPPLQPVHCRLPATGAAEARRLRVFDLSAGGLSFRCGAEDTAYAPARELGACGLELPAAPPLQVVLTVAHASLVRARDGGREQRIGCRFGPLPAAAERAIQRYIFAVERLRSARERGA